MNRATVYQTCSFETNRAVDGCQRGYPRNDTPRVVPLSDGAGEITELGSEVERWQVGDRVMANFTRDWISGLVHEKASREKALRSGLGGGIDGVLAESVTMDSSALVRIPEHLIYRQASTSRCAAVTACNALASAAKHDILRPNRGLRHHKIPPGGMF